MLLISVTGWKNPVCVTVHIRITYTPAVAPAPPLSRSAKLLKTLSFLPLVVPWI